MVTDFKAEYSTTALDVTGQPTVMTMSVFGWILIQIKVSPSAFDWNLRGSRTAVVSEISADRISGSGWKEYIC